MTDATSTGYILVTDGSQGIGECFADALAKRGCNLILVARSKEKLEAIAASLRQKYRVQVEILVKDFSLERTASEVAEYCAGFSIHGLINNAGIGLGDRFASEPLDRVIEMLNINIMTLTKLTHLLLPSLRGNRGMIVNVASLPIRLLPTATTCRVRPCSRV